MEFQETSLYNRDLVKFLKEYREEWNISRQVLAEEIGVSSVFNWEKGGVVGNNSMRLINCLLYTSPSPRDRQKSRMPSSA